MQFFPVYILAQLGNRILMFFYNWYIASFFAFSDFFTSVFEALDQTWALRVTARYLFRPLYQDRTIVGFVLGFIFRLGRLIIGSMLYGGVFIVGVSLYLAFAAIPVLIILYGFS